MNYFYRRRRNFIAGIIFTEGCIGICAEEKSLFGDASQESSKVPKSVRTEP